jgi:intracellular sulfur oxidation DsrE/DsrF family protein
MNEKDFQSSLARRQFLARIGAGTGVLGAAAAVPSTAWAQSAGDTRWQPGRHELDEWYDKVPGQHRFVFDTISAEGLASGLQFVNTYLETNKASYGLQDSDSAVIVIVRHKSTAFGFNDAMWGKYGAQLSEQANNFVDPKTKEIPKANIYATTSNASGRPGPLDTLIKRGVQIAVCQRATRAIAGAIAKAVSSDTDSVLTELSANLLGNGRLVPAGIVAVNRAQEHGYALYNAG